MALLGKVGNILRQSSAKTISPEVYQSIRCVSSVANSQFTIGAGEHACNVKEHLGSRVGMNHTIYRRSFGGIGAFGGSGYGVRSYSAGGAAAGAVASHSSTAALANVAGGSALNLALFWHINSGVREILADYVHHEMTRNVMLIYLRLFLIIAAKDVFVSLVF